MNFDDILSVPGFPVDDEAVNNLNVIMFCLASDFMKENVGEIEQIVPDYERKCITVVFKIDYLTNEPDHDGSYLADLFRIADAVGIHPAEDGSIRVSFSVVVWK